VSVQSAIALSFLAMTLLLLPGCPEDFFRQCNGDDECGSGGVCSEDGLCVSTDRRPANDDDDVDDDDSGDDDSTDDDDDSGDDSPVGDGERPVAVCAADIVSAPFDTVQLDGSGSSPSPLSYQWVLTVPPGSAATLDSSTSATPSITLDLAGTYDGVLTVTDDDGETDSCTQSIEAVPNDNFRIEMYWANSGDDMDLHLLEANDGTGVAGSPRTDSDCYYANCGGTFGTPIDWGVVGDTADDPRMEQDDISGVGPENTSITSPALAPYDGDYIVFVHDYPGSSYTPANDVTVNIYLNGALSQTFNFQHVGEDDDYYVAKIHWPTGVITPCNGVATSPAAGCP